MTDDLLTIGELEAMSARLANDPRVTITNLGPSRSERTIDMITIGNGEHDALVVGVPHSNEPIGAATVVRMIDLLLKDKTANRGYRWHFISAIDPDGLALNEGWLKGPRTITRYLEDFFRPALLRQPETTFPLDIPEAHFDECTPENEAWQRAFALTRPSLHASLHHCDFGGAFYSLSRALPEALPGLKASLKDSGLGINDLDGGVMAAERWADGITRYPSVPELIAQAKATGATWAYPWKVGEMSPGYGEAEHGTFTIMPEVPMWDAATLHSEESSGISQGQHELMLKEITSRTSELAARHVEQLSTRSLSPDAIECLWSIQGSLKMMPSPDTGEFTDPTDGGDILSARKFETLHTQQVLFALRTYGMLIRLANLILMEHPDDTAALDARSEAQQALRVEIATIEDRTSLTPVPLEVTTGLQMSSIFICAEALLRQG